MEQVTTHDSASADFAPSFADRIKHLVAQVGVFFDISAYKNEIARYERELDD